MSARVPWTASLGGRVLGLLFTLEKGLCSRAPSLPPPPPATTRQERRGLSQQKVGAPTPTNHQAGAGSCRTTCESRFFHWNSRQMTRALQAGGREAAKGQ